MSNAMNRARIDGIVKLQREYFQTNETKDVKFRLENLKKLKSLILRYENKINEALKKDLGKSRFESYASEIGLVLNELSFSISHLKKWARPTRVRTDLVNFYAKSYIVHEPYGVSLIISPWNYPFQLLINPLIGSISAGNCSVLKPANYSEHTTEIICSMIEENFDEKYISVVPGDRRVIQDLLNQRFDYIFFTGSPGLGKIVMEKAAKHLTPVSLELGGKNPCIVEEDANLDLAARRIVFGKFLNAGQTCVAPDYLLVNARIKKELIEKIKRHIDASYGNDPRKSPDLCRIINNDRFVKLSKFIAAGDVICGGETDRHERYIAPTIIDNVSPDDPVMKQEIFGPVLPVIMYNNLDEAVSYINSNEKPLELYLFTSSKKIKKRVLSQTSSGGCCINDTVVHFINPHLPFGGVGNSGMGAYHGKSSFHTFSHHRSVMAKTTLFDIPLRYAPYRNKLKLVKLFLK